MLLHGALVFAAAVVAGMVAAAAASRVPPCANIAAAERERARIEGRCEGRAPIVDVAAGAAARPARAPVPELRGRAFNRGDARVARFVVATDYRPSAEQRDWVLDQRPRPPATLPLGGELRVVLSDGTLVRVPNVRGGFARALALLHRAGLSWSAHEGATGQVVGQAPAPGAEVRRGTSVALRTAPGPLALAPESTRPEVAPPPAAPARPPTSAPPTATTPTATTPTATTTPTTTAPAATTPAATTSAPTAPSTATMPDVAGMIFDAARERLAGFSIQRVHRAGVEPGGTVIGQSPAPGTALATGASVRLVLSDGSLVRMPRVAGLALGDARQRLAVGELRVVVNNVAADARAGTVLSQRPADGEIATRGSTVRLNVSSGPAAAPTLKLPNVVGVPFERAQSQLARFRVERSERGAREPVGMVLEQIPPAGSALAAGSTVALIVSSGGRPEAIEVPNVVAQSIDAAAAALSEFRVDREMVASVEPAGHVLAQEPAAGASVAPGGTVRVRVSDGSLVAVPTLEKKRLADARAAAQANGLTIAAPSDAADDARVVEQQPPAGTAVARGSAVSVTLQAPVSAADPALADGFARAQDFVRAAPPVIWVLTAVALLLFLLLVPRARRRRAAAVEPNAMVQPVLDASPAEAPAPPAAPPPTVTPVPAPPRWTAQARFEIDPVRTVARGAAPRGPEIGLAARLDAGTKGARELAPAADERTEPTSEESR